MGRRATSTTKSGKFMNPADQERKMARKRELKKNKKQRVTVRQALLKSKDPEEIIEQLEKLDQQEFEAGADTSLKKQVMNEKRSKLKGTYFNVLSMYRNEKQMEKVKDMQLKMQQYEIARQQMEQNFEAVKFSKEADPGEIPLPDGLAIPGAAMTPALPSAIPAHLLLPDASHKPGILKKTGPLRKGPKSDHPPGPPCGLPPEFSGSEDEEDDDDGELSDRRRRVRFGDEPSDRRRQEREMAPNEFDAGEGPPPLMSLRPLAPNAPVFPPPGPRLNRPPMPPPGLPPPRMGLRAPPPPPYGKPRNAVPPPPIRPPMGVGIGPHPTQVPPPNSAAVISAEPQVVKRSSGGATISAQPQLRNMQKEAVRFVPTNLRVHRPTPQQTKRPSRPVGSATGIGSLTTQVPQQTQQISTDDAYADFMKEMTDLL